LGNAKLLVERKKRDPCAAHSHDSHLVISSFH